MHAYLVGIFLSLITFTFFQGGLSHVDQVEDRSHFPTYTNMLEALSVKIDRISCEVIKNNLHNQCRLQSLYNLSCIINEPV